MLVKFFEENVTQTRLPAGRQGQKLLERGKSYGPNHYQLFVEIGIGGTSDFQQHGHHSAV
jgi:hypothetical protein